jgi:hypothetical protein
MSMNKRTQGILITTALLGLCFAVGPASILATGEIEPGSSACINCHTDLEEMDSYGADAAGGGGAIAG